MCVCVVYYLLILWCGLIYDTCVRCVFWPDKNIIITLSTISYFIYKYRAFERVRLRVSSAAAHVAEYDRAAILRIYKHKVINYINLCVCVFRSCCFCTLPKCTLCWVHKKGCLFESRAHLSLSLYTRI